MKQEIRTERDRLIEMGKARRASQWPMRGIGMPTELMKALRKSESGKAPDAGIHILLKKSHRNSFNRLARKLDVRSNVLARALIDAAVKLGPEGIVIFIDAANEAENDLPSKFRKSRKRSFHDRMKALARGEDDPEREEDTDDDDEDAGEDEDELETPATGEPTRQLKKKKERRRMTGAPRPEKGGRAM